MALAHDYLNQRGGAERVVVELTRMFPSAPLYTSIYRPSSTFSELERVEIRTSFLDRLPVDRRFRNLLPLYPTAFASLGPVAADTLLASSSGWAHGLRVTAPGRVIVYCHNPARWLYGEPYLNISSVQQKLSAPLRPWLRRWDRQAAARADVYVANSRTTQARIKMIYGREAEVVPPPVEIGRFTPTPRGERLLVVSRLLPYKRIDVVVDAATKSGLELDIVGLGPALDDLAERAGPTVRFLGTVDDAVLADLMQGCRALCLPGVEDFGITAVEAQAAGKPVIAFGSGGALETVEDGRTGVFFHEHTAAAFLAALRRCDGIQLDPVAIARRVGRFSPDAFRQRMLAVLRRATSTSN